MTLGGGFSRATLLGFFTAAAAILIGINHTVQQNIWLRAEVRALQHQLQTEQRYRDAWGHTPYAALQQGSRAPALTADGGTAQKSACQATRTHHNSVDSSDAFPADPGPACGSDGSCSRRSADHPHRAEAFDAALRTLAGLTFVGMIAGGALAYKRLDYAPVWLQRRLQASLVPKGSTPITVPPSKLVAYRVDAWFSTNSYSKVLSLLYLTIALVCVGGLGIFIVTHSTLYEAFWEAIAGVGIDWTFKAVSTEGGAAEAGFMARLMGVGVSVGGMLVTALMLGIVSDAISDKIEDLKKGKSDVLETHHTLILGWSDKVVAIVDQLCNANESEGGHPIVIMGELEKQQMDEEIRKHEINFRGSRVICRTGNPLLGVDLAKVSVHTARAIIVLAGSDDPDQSDARMLRVVLSLMGVHNRLKQEGAPGLQGHIVAEVCDVDNEKLVRLVGTSHVHTVVSNDIIGRLMIQCARQPGLATVWEQIMGFEGDEFYMQEWPQMVGKRFDEVLISFPEAVPLGVKRAEDSSVMLNPPDDYTICEGDEILVLAEDDDTYAPSTSAPCVCGGACPEWGMRRETEKILFLGWRRDMDDMIAVLDSFVSRGSELWLYNGVPIEERDKMLLAGGLDPTTLVNLKLVYKDPQLFGDTVSRRRLEELHPEEFSSVLILADEAALTRDVADADSRSLATLLLLRDIQTEHMGLARTGSGRLILKEEPGGAAGGMMWFDSMQNAVRQTVVISEILDSRTRSLIQDLRVSEFVLSNKLVSMTLSMVAENPEVITILQELFTEEGNELYIYPAARYLHPKECLSFFDVMARAREKQEIVVGYKPFGSRPIVNPKDKSVLQLCVEHTEGFVILAEEVC